LPAGELAMFDILVERHPDYVSRDDLSERTEYKRSSRDTYLARMRAKQLIVMGSDGVRASDTLF
jgi:hypothetical protein